jgi:hypothetical protein
MAGKPGSVIGETISHSNDADIEKRRNVYIAEIRDHYAKEYARVLNVDSIANRRTRAIASRVDTSLWGHKNRIVRNVQVMKHTFVYSKTSVIVIAFKATIDGTSCIYAFAHCQCRPDGTVIPEYVCTGPTYRSQDGEYRNRIIPWEQYNALFEMFSDVTAMVEEPIVGRLANGRLTFQTDFYYPNSCRADRDGLIDMVNTMRMPVKLMIICWLYDYYQIQRGIVENHINPAYQFVLGQDEDRPVFDAIIAKIGDNGYARILYRISCYFGGGIMNRTTLLQEIQIGQKIFPLTAIEAVKTDDINYHVWREVYVNNLVCNLVLNLICPSFSFINNWFYVQNAHAGIFDNKAMHDKYEHSEIAAGVTTQLKEIDKANYIDNERAKGYITGKFGRLSMSIHKSIIYADSDVRLTDLAVCLTAEHVGRTLRDIPALISSGELASGTELVFTDTEMFHTHMFEFVYAFYCMNSKAGVIHGDLHMNNATIYSLYVMSYDGTEYVPDARVAFVIEGDMYRFRHRGLFSMVIDFSRAIIGDYSQLEHDFSPRFADAYFKEQRLRSLQLIYHYFPKMVTKYQVALEALLNNNFPLMFKILTAIDTFAIMSNISTMFSIDTAFTSGDAKIAPGAHKLLTALIKQSEALITGLLRDAIDSRVTRAEDIEWPNLTIIKKVFASYRVGDKAETLPPGEIVDIFNSDNDVIYDIANYDEWGPLLSLDKEIELRKKHGLEIHQGIKQWIEYKRSDETEAIEALTHKYEQEEKDVLEFEAWMMM